MIKNSTINISMQSTVDIHDNLCHNSTYTYANYNVVQVTVYFEICSERKYNVETRMLNSILHSAIGLVYLFKVNL